VVRIWLCIIYFHGVCGVYLVDESATTFNVNHKIHKRCFLTVLSCKAPTSLDYASRWRLRRFRPRTFTCFEPNDSGQFRCHLNPLFTVIWPRHGLRGQATALDLSHASTLWNSTLRDHWRKTRPSVSFSIGLGSLSWGIAPL